MSVYDTVMNGEAVFWPVLDENGRYDVWSAHIIMGGPELPYQEFCDLMDEATAGLDAGGSA